MARLSQDELIAGLSAIVGPTHVSTSRPDRVAYSADFWPKAQIWKLDGDVDRYPPDCVVWPADEAQVAAVLEFCNEHVIPVVPYGGGSGVCGGTIPIRGGVVVDVKRMAKLVEIDERSLTCIADAGINGQHLEDRLNARGLTLGHFPSSIMCSTLGGWLAARSAGQYSSRYGKIEDMVLGLRIAFPGGLVRDTSQRAPGAADWTQLIVGSEGTLGIITRAELAVHPLPEDRRLRAFRFRHLKDGLGAMRGVMQSGLKPTVLRLYDPFDSLIALGKDGGDSPSRGPLSAIGKALGAVGGKRAMDKTLGPLGRRMKRAALIGALKAPNVTNRLAAAAPSPCLLIIGFEGAEETVHHDARAANAILAEAGGNDAGSRPGEIWLEHRYSVGFKQTRIFEVGAFVDTMEVATTWDQLEGLYDAVRKAVYPHAFIMAHFSHAYREGCSIYFTMAAYRKDPKRAEQHYERLWEVATAAVQAAGGTTSHHHGVGLSKRNAMAREHGDMLRVWRALKDAVDPRCVMNPGKLFPDEPTVAGAPQEMLA